MMEVEKRLFGEFVDNSRVIPDFINTRLRTNKNVFFLAQDLFLTFKPLFRDIILPQNLVEECFLDFTDILEAMMEEDAIISIDYIKMIKDILTYYEGYCIQEECYEAAENIKKMREILKNINV